MISRKDFNNLGPNSTWIIFKFSGSPCYYGLIIINDITIKFHTFCQLQHQIYHKIDFPKLLTKPKK
jgi:hypothetical protein